MTMNSGQENMPKGEPSDFIAQMADDLTPVTPIRPLHAWLGVALAVVVTVMALMVVEGLWSGLTMGEASAYFFIVHGLLLVMGIAAATNVIRMARPRVGNDYSGAKWATGMVAVLPFAALWSLFSAPELAHAHSLAWGLSCVAAATLSSSLTFVVLIMWLRRGAPVSLRSAGWQSGVAAGGMGTVAYALCCPLDDIVHLGIYHVAPIGITALIGAVVVPKLVRW